MKKLYGVMSLLLICAILFSGCGENSVIPGGDTEASGTATESARTPFETDASDGTDAGGIEFPDIAEAPKHSLLDLGTLFGSGENNFYNLDFVDVEFDCNNVELYGNLLLCMGVDYPDDVDESGRTYLRLYDISTKTAFPEFKIDGIYDCGFTGKGNIYLVESDVNRTSEMQKIYLYDSSFEQLYAYTIKKIQSEQLSAMFSYDEKYLVYGVSAGLVYIIETESGESKTVECGAPRLYSLTCTEKYVYFGTIDYNSSEVRVNPETAEIKIETIEADGSNLILLSHGIRAALNFNLLYAFNDENRSDVDIMPADGMQGITDYGAGRFACVDYNSGCAVFDMKSGIVYSGTTDYNLYFVYISENGYAVTQALADGKALFYIWDYLSETPQSIDVINSTANHSIDDITHDIAAEISKNKNIEIFYGSEGNDFDCDYISKCINNKYAIYSAVCMVSSFLSDIPDSMISALCFDGERPLKIKLYLCGGLYGVGSDGIGMASGVTFNDDNGDICVAVDIGYIELINNLAHEFSHVIDYRLTYLSDTGIDILSEWEKLNPVGFKYTDAYGSYSDGNISEKYTAFGTESDDMIYFVDTYAKTFPTEDRARIFEYLFTYSEDDAGTPIRGEHMLKKARYYCAMLRFAFPQIGEGNDRLVWETLTGEPDMNEFADIFNSTVAPVTGFVTDNIPKG